MTEYKDKLLYANDLIYVGKEYTRTFDNDGDKVKGYKFLFKENENQQYPKRFWGTETTKGADELEEGERYVIGYVEKPITVNGNDAKLRSARFFGKPKQNTQEQQSVSEKPGIKLNNSIKEATQNITQRNKIVEGNEQLKSLADECVKLGNQFLNTFEGKYKDFYHWVEDAESVGTDYFAKSDTNRDVEKKALYDYIVDKIKEEI